MYDIVGDIHGHARELSKLLESVGYQRHGSGYRHADRKLVFVGDFIDRGPEIAETLKLVRATLDAGDGFAVMGNHEYNAIAFHTRCGDDWFRPHTAKNLKQHQATLDQLSSQQLQESLGWFRTLPAAIELDGIRVVHAAWHSADIDRIAIGRRQLGDFTPSFLQLACDANSALFAAVENVLKGPEVELPPEFSYTDVGGLKRTTARVRWYLDSAEVTFDQYCIGAGSSLPTVAVEQVVGVVKGYPSAAPPVFIGHYWLTGQPAPLAANVACVDYSVAKQGKLCMYRWQGESELTAENFHWTAPESDKL